MEKIRQDITLDRPVVLVGLMGSGKTTLGRALADSLGLAFTDADDVIVAQAGMSIPDIFETHGEDHFRALERDVIASLMTDGDAPRIIATGGGAFMNDATRAVIKQQALSLWIKADLETLVARIGGGEGRPLLAGGDARAKLAALIDKRYPIYAQADITVETASEEAEQTLNNIINALKRYGT